MYRPSAFSPKFDCRVDFLTNTPIEIVSYIGVDVLPLDGGYVLFESTSGGNCVFEYTSASVSGNNITLMCSALTWSNSNFYTDPTYPLTPENQMYGTISRTITSADWNDIVDHVLNKLNPHDVTKLQIGLGNVDNTSDINKPISNATQEALDNKADLVNGKVPATQLPDSHSLQLGTTHEDAFYGDHGEAAYQHSLLRQGNPHNVTKGDLGLGNVDNTSDHNKPVSTAQQQAIDLVQTNLTTHEQDESNPHNVSKSQVGLDNVDNTSDVNKPVSTAQQQAIDLVQTNLTTHEQDTSNPHGVTKSQVGLGNVDNTSDLNKPISTATQQGLNGVQSNLDTHIADKNNPHQVTKVQVGLGNVDNTSDSDKPVSTLTAAELAKKVNIAQGVSNSALVTDNSGDVVTEPKASGFNKPYSNSTPLVPSIDGSAGSDEYLSHSDHQHPSETFTIADITVLVSDWVNDNTYVDYPYKATITNSNVTANYTPFVVFSQETVSKGIYAQVAETSSNVIYIYASELPSTNTIVKTIVLIRRI